MSDESESQSAVIKRAMQSMAMKQAMAEKEAAEMRLLGALWWLARNDIISESRARELAAVPSSEWDRRIQDAAKRRSGNG